MRTIGTLLLPALAAGLAVLGYFTLGAPASPAPLAAAAELAVVLALFALMLGTAVLRPLRSARTALRQALPEHLPERGSFGEIAREMEAAARHIEAQRLALERSAREQAATSAQLAASEERYALAVRSSNDGLWEWDFERELVSPSPRWNSMLGLPPHWQATPAQWQGLIHPEDADSCRLALEALMGSAAGSFQHQHRLRHRDGSYRWVLSRGSVIRHASGKPYRMVGLDTDVTALKRIESVLKEIIAGTSGTSGEAFFRAMVRHFAGALGVPVAFITECVDHPATRLRTLAFWTDDHFAENFEYALPGTPCETVVGEGRVCFHPSGVGRVFPVEEGYEGYLGIPIVGSSGRAIGHLAFLDRKLMSDEMLIDAVYRIFTARAAAELEKKAIEQELEQLRRQHPRSQAVHAN
jgi:PAS domain S-box-containing protein